jgi:chromate transporter
MTAPAQNPLPEVPFSQAVWFWFKLGFISFGGPAGQIALMHRELVEEKRWISDARFLHALNFCMLLPGPEAQQLATYLGWLMHRTWGGIVAGALFVLPSLFILVGLSWAYMVFGDQTWMAGILYGIKPAVAALVLAALVRIGGKTLGKPRQSPVLWGLALGSFVALTWGSVPFPAVVAVAALVGALVARRWPNQLGQAVGHRASGARQAPAQPKAVVDDDTPTPPHARWQRNKAWAVVLWGVGLFALPMVAVAFAVGQGWAAPALLDMCWFFTKAAWLTFGGAYAVLPYVFQGAVLQFGWLSAAQMMDGLALGETTPGPLIMVVTFVGFLGGWQHQVLGPHAVWAGAATAAVLVTWFTFLPSFVFILLGGPWVEASHGRSLTLAPLQAVTAAVVGVVASLALFFVAHTLDSTLASGLMPQKIDGLALVMMGLAWLLLVRFKRQAMEVIALCALLGLAHSGW